MAGPLGDHWVSHGPRLLRAKLRICEGGKPLSRSDLFRKLNQLPMCNENSLRFSRSLGRNSFGCPSLSPSLDNSASISSRPLKLPSVTLNHCKTNFSLSCFQVTWI